ncbi:hypothetical protein Barb4_01542 [Bacteroidales bacterium Barb4]|nr:hypothetical protein Barb4_01542 [Bacteroidales bacterium Barb4]
MRQRYVFTNRFAFSASVFRTAASNLPDSTPADTGVFNLVGGVGSDYRLSASFGYFTRTGEVTKLRGVGLPDSGECDYFTRTGEVVLLKGVRLPLSGRAAYLIRTISRYALERDAVVIVKRSPVRFST